MKRIRSAGGGGGGGGNSVAKKARTADATIVAAGGGGGGGGGASAAGGAGGGGGASAAASAAVSSVVGAVDRPIVYRSRRHDIGEEQAVRYQTIQFFKERGFISEKDINDLDIHHLNRENYDKLLAIGRENRERITEQKATITLPNPVRADRRTSRIVSGVESLVGHTTRGVSRAGSLVGGVGRTIRSRARIYKAKNSVAMDCVNSSVSSRSVSLLTKTNGDPNMDTLEILCTQWLPKILYAAYRVTNKAEYLTAFDILVPNDTEKTNLQNNVIHYQEFITIVGMSPIFLVNLTLFLERKRDEDNKGKNEEEQKRNKENKEKVLTAYISIVNMDQVLKNQIIEQMKLVFVERCISTINEYCKTQSTINMMFKGYVIRPPEVRVKKVPVRARSRSMKDRKGSRSGSRKPANRGRGSSRRGRRDSRSRSRSHGRRDSGSRTSGIEGDADMSSVPEAHHNIFFKIVAKERYDAYNVENGGIGETIVGTFVPYSMSDVSNSGTYTTTLDPKVVFRGSVIHRIDTFPTNGIFTHAKELYTLYEFVRYVDTYTLEHRAFKLLGKEKELDMYVVTDTIDFFTSIKDNADQHLNETLSILFKPNSVTKIVDFMDKTAHIDLKRITRISSPEKTLSLMEKFRPYVTKNWYLIKLVSVAFSTIIMVTILIGIFGKSLGLNRLLVECNTFINTCTQDFMYVPYVPTSLPSTSLPVKNPLLGGGGLGVTNVMKHFIPTKECATLLGGITPTDWAIIGSGIGVVTAKHKEVLPVDNMRITRLYSIVIALLCSSLQGASVLLMLPDILPSPADFEVWGYSLESHPILKSISSATTLWRPGTRSKLEVETFKYSDFFNGFVEAYSNPTPYEITRVALKSAKVMVYLAPVTLSVYYMFMMSLTWGAWLGMFGLYLFYGFIIKGAYHVSAKYLSLASFMDPHAKTFDYALKTIDPEFKPKDPEIELFVRRAIDDINLMVPYLRTVIDEVYTELGTLFPKHEMSIGHGYLAENMEKIRLFSKKLTNSINFTVDKHDGVNFLKLVYAKGDTVKGGTVKGDTSQRSSVAHSTLKGVFSRTIHHLKRVASSTASILKRKKGNQLPKTMELLCAILEKMTYSVQQSMIAYLINAASIHSTQYTPDNIYNALIIDPKTTALLLSKPSDDTRKQILLRSNIGHIINALVYNALIKKCFSNKTQVYNYILTRWLQIRDICLKKRKYVIRVDPSDVLQQDFIHPLISQPQSFSTAHHLNKHLHPRDDMPLLEESSSPHDAAGGAPHDAAAAAGGGGGGGAADSYVPIDFE